jgi:hypothetical protein
MKKIYKQIMVILLCFAVLVPILPAVKVSAYAQGTTLGGTLNIYNVSTNYSAAYLTIGDTISITDVSTLSLSSGEAIIPSDIRYRWVRVLNPGSDEVDIYATPSSSASYTIQGADVGNFVKVYVSVEGVSGEIGIGQTQNIAKTPGLTASYDSNITAPIGTYENSFDLNNITLSLSGQNLTAETSGPRHFSISSYDGTGIIDDIEVDRDTNELLFNFKSSAVVGNTASVTLYASTDYYAATVSGLTNTAAQVTLTIQVVDKQSQTIAFNPTTVSKTTADPQFTMTPALTTTGGTGDITYESSSLIVAVVNDYSGLVTINGPGTTTITATKEADQYYHEATATYTLTVTEYTAPSNPSEPSQPSTPSTPSAPSAPSGPPSNYTPVFPTVTITPETEPNGYNFPPCINKEITISADGKEVTSKTGVIAKIVETADGVFVEAGINPTGSVNTHSTAAAACLAARIAKAKGYDKITVNVPSFARGLSKNAVQKIICGAQGTDVTLSLTSAYYGDELGTITFPITRSTGQILTSLYFGTARTEHIERYIESRWNTDALGGFETDQRGGWGSAATLTMDLGKLGIDTYPDDLLYAVIYDTSDGRWYQSPVTVKDGIAVFKTSRTGIITFTTNPVSNL